jgi:hypothetical protein
MVGAQPVLEGGRLQLDGKLDLDGIVGRDPRRQQGDGVLRTAEAFARLGDGEVVERALQVARDLGGVHPEAEARVHGLVDRCSEAAHGSRKREF